MKIFIDLKYVPAIDIQCLEYDVEYDDISSFFIDICNLISDTKCAKFNVSGFGDSHWPVDISTDLPVLLEQLPSAIASIVSNQDCFDIDFYEQGVERYLHFKRDNYTYTIQCKSMLDWEPKNPEHINRNDLLVMLNSVKNEFLQYTDKLLLQDPVRTWMGEWECPEQ